uniref:Uncharacterized protein n=1 Tax=Tetranychus urticae TaxID=32264 RepID=T1KLE9_TETUR
MSCDPSVSARALAGAYSIEKVECFMYGPGPSIPSNVYCLTQWSPTWVPWSEIHMDDDPISALPKLQSFDKQIWEKFANTQVIENHVTMKYTCRWCGHGSDDKSNMNKHEKRCSVVGAPGHVHNKHCKNCPEPAKYTRREDGRHQNKGRPCKKN